MGMMSALRRMFGPKGLKYGVVLREGDRQPRWTPDNYQQLAKEGYEQNVYVFRSIDLVAVNGARIPWTLFRVGRDGEPTEIKSHPLLTLLQKPNALNSKAPFFENVIGYRQLDGNSYIRKIKANQNAKQSELWTLRPDLVRVVPGTRAEPVGGYLYGRPGSEDFLEPDEVLHWRTFHPLNDFFGLSPIRVAARSVDQSNAASAWNTAMLQNGARPSGVVEVDGTMTDQAFSRWKADLKKKYTGEANAGEPMLLEGGGTWKQLSLSPVDMDYLKSQNLTAKQIALVFNVPPEMIGDPEVKQFANHKEARKALYEDNIVPLMENLRDELNMWLTPDFGPDLYLDLDLEQVPALREDRDSKWQRAQQSTFLTTNEKRALVGLEDIGPEGDEILVPMNVVPIDFVVGSGGSTADQASKRGPGPDVGKSDDLESVLAFGLDTEEQKAQHWKTMDRRRELLAKQVQSKVESTFDGERRKVKAAMASVKAPELLEDAAANAVVGNAPSWTEMYEKGIYGPVADNLATDVFRGLKRQAGAREVKQDDLEGARAIWGAQIAEYVNSNLAARVTGVLDTTRKQIARIIQNGIDEGLGAAEIKRQVDGLYLEQIIPNRSAVIARTETIAASNLGSQLGAKAVGMPLDKEWISTKDGRVRGLEPGDEFDHRESTISSVDIDEPYTVSGQQMMFPGDSSKGASAGNTVNCRCTEGYRVRR